MEGAIESSEAALDRLSHPGQIFYTTASYSECERNHCLYPHPLADQGLQIYDLQAYLSRAGDAAQRSHRHGFWQCILFFDSGVHYVDLRRHEYSPGSLLLLPEGAVHRFNGSEVKGVLLHFLGSFFARSPEDAKRLLQLRVAALDSPFYSPGKKDEEKLHTLVDWLHGESQHPQQDQHFQRALLHALALLLLRCAGEGGPERNDYLAFLHLVEERYIERPPIPELARALQLSTKRLYSITTNAVGLSPGRVVEGRLLLEAQRRLVHSDEPVSTIAFDLGFSDPAYFSRFFKKQIDQTPRQFRDSHLRRI